MPTQQRQHSQDRAADAQGGVPAMIRHLCLCECGCQRPQNQDRAGAWAAGDSGLFFVADGVGGRYAGERASQTIADALAAWWGGGRQLPVDTASDQLWRLIESCHTRIASATPAGEAVRQHAGAFVDQRWRLHPALGGGQPHLPYPPPSAACQNHPADVGRHRRRQAAPGGRYRPKPAQHAQRYLPPRRPICPLFGRRLQLLPGRLPTPPAGAGTARRTPAWRG